jgi:trk system potassium uptake protein TrkA
VKIVIVGAGNVGYSLAQTLSSAGHDIVVIESREEYAQVLENELDVQVVVGNGSRPSVLAEAGISENSSVDFLIACSNKDEVNIMACWQAKHLGVRRVLSRAKNAEYTESPEWARALGIDEILSPERSVARELEEMLWVNSAVHTTEFLSGEAGSYAFRVTEESAINGKKLSSLSADYPDFAGVFIFVEREGKGFTPSGDWVAQQGDLCYLITFRHASKEVEKLFTSQNTKRIRRIMIAGGGNSGMAVTRRLLRKHAGVEIKIIDPDYETCQQIASEFPQIVVLHGDALDDKLLTHEGISSMDGFVAATGRDERNLILASLAKTLQAKKSIAIVRSLSLSRLSSHLPVDAVVNPNESLASVILRYVRYPESAGSLSLIDRINSEILEVVVPKACPIAGKPIHTLNLPKGLIFAMIKREGKILLPRGNTEIQPDDILLIFSSQENMDKITDMLGLNL